MGETPKRSKSSPRNQVTFRLGVNKTRNGEVTWSQKNWTKEEEVGKKRKKKVASEYQNYTHCITATSTSRKRSRIKFLSKLRVIRAVSEALRVQRLNLSNEELPSGMVFYKF